jgi:hypothetical protein
MPGSNKSDGLKAFEGFDSISSDPYPKNSVKMDACNLCRSRIKRIACIHKGVDSLWCGAREQLCLQTGPADGILRGIHDLGDSIAQNAAAHSARS